VSPPASRDLTGKVAVVTGASRGIGEAIAAGLAAAGARLVLASRKLEDVEAVAELIRAEGGEAVAVACHTGRPADVQALAERAREIYGGVDVLVNNAATNPHFGPLLEAEESHWDKTFEVNVKGYVHAIRACVPLMRERGGGAIVNVASVTFYWGEALLASYVASKGAVIGFTRALAREAGPENIRVNAVAPGAFPTAATEIHADQDKLWEDVLAAQSLKRRGEVEDVARAIAFFAGEDSRFVTGQTLLVDGGWMRG
jgi:3-oxoacyl-[acyl-carrier protein] reductase